MHFVICIFDQAGGPIPPLHDRHVVRFRFFFARPVGWRGSEAARRKDFDAVFFPSFPSLFFFRHRQSVGRTRVLHDPSCSFSSSRFRRFASTSSSWVWLIFFFICVRSILLGDGGFIDVRAVSSLWPMLCGPRPVVSGFVSACWICRRPSADDRIWRGRIFPCR